MEPKTPTDPQTPSSSSVSYLRSLQTWGGSSIPPACLATLVIGLHARPVRPFPLSFSLPLFASSYLNLAGYPTDAAAVSSAWSGLYAVLALRRKQETTRWLPDRFSARGLARGAAIGLGLVNCVSGLLAYGLGDRERDARARVEMNRWGEQDK